MSSLSDAIATSARAEANKEYEKRRKEELDKLWATGTKKEKAFAHKVLKLALRII